MRCPDGQKRRPDHAGAAWRLHRRAVHPHCHHHRLQQSGLCRRGRADDGADDLGECAFFDHGRPRPAPPCPALPYTISKHDTPNTGNCAYGPQITDCYDRITLTPQNANETAAFIASDGNAYTLNVGGVAPLTGSTCPAEPTRQGAIYYDVPERATTRFCVYGRVSPVNAIRIVKSANPTAADTNFGFTSTQTGGTSQAFPASFTLTGANSTTTSEIIRTYAGGTANIRETALTGWKLTSLSCTASDGNLSGVTTSPTTGVTLTKLPTGSTNRLITCTFANTRDNPQMEVEKTVSPTSISAPGGLNYTITVRNTGNVPLTGVTLADTVTQQGATLATPTPAYA